MAHLITFAELATWTQNDVDKVTADPFAEEVLDKVSGLVRFLAGQPDWEIANTPFDARLVALVVAKRCYANPDQEVSSGVGPINARVLDVAALLLDLTDTERATLTKYNLTGDPDAAPGGLYLISMTAPPQTILDTVLYVGDDQQINLGDELEWMIPFFNPGDPGDPNLYPEEV